MKGKVLKSTGSFYTVLADDNNIYECSLKGNFKIKGIKSTNPIAVGDNVEFEIDTFHSSASINKIAPRNNYIIRKSTKLSKQTHIIAANIDQAVLMITLKTPRTSTGFMDRFLITAEAYHIPSIILFNKIDIYTEKELAEIRELENVYTKASYTCIETSAKNNINIDKVSEILKGKISLISGHSGVGKSTIINMIEPNLKLKTDEVSNFNDKGKHTTTFAEMFKLSNGGYIIDTPGIKEFGIVDFEKEELSHRFPEMRKYMNKCRFDNCSHLHEPGCAVKEALNNNEISKLRYNNYIAILSGDSFDEDYEK